MTIPVKINIISRICDLAEAERLTGDDIEQSFRKAMEKRSSADGKSRGGPMGVPVSEIVADMMTNAGERAVDKIEISTEGKLTMDGGRIVISYDETEATGMEGCLTTMQFDEEQRGLVTMLRTGNLNSSLTFNAETRQICQYDPGMGLPPFEMTVRTYHIDNDVTERGGFIGIDYTVETHGVMVEFNSLRMRIRPLAVSPFAEI